MKRLQIPEKLMYEKFYVHQKILKHEIAAVNLLKNYFLKDAKKICKPNNRDLNRDWIILKPFISCFSNLLMYFCYRFSAFICTAFFWTRKWYTAQKWSFPLRISSVNVNKSVSCGFGHIYWRNPTLKTSFLCSGIYSLKLKIFSSIFIQRRIQNPGRYQRWIF